MSMLASGQITMLVFIAYTEIVACAVGVGPRSSASSGAPIGRSSSRSMTMLVLPGLASQATVQREGQNLSVTGCRWPYGTSSLGFWARQALRSASRRPSRVGASGGRACVGGERIGALSSRLGLTGYGVQRMARPMHNDRTQIWGKPDGVPLSSDVQPIR